MKGHPVESIRVGLQWDKDTMSLKVTDDPGLLGAQVRWVLSDTDFSFVFPSSSQFRVRILHPSTPPLHPTTPTQKLIEYFEKSGNKFTITNGGEHYELSLYDCARDPRLRRPSVVAASETDCTKTWGTHIKPADWGDVDEELSDD